ncbi:hypothetical protein HQQ80_04285 [Microbacteriaceae bacterium VKM Ac-2855]|nr:hypothetical protein [Microbacteriaceae bacterium VKM Ac-2855]
MSAAFRRVHDDFLRPPRGAAMWLADGVRLLGVLSMLATLIFFSPVDAGMFSLALFGVVLPRMLGVRAGLDAAFGLSVLVAAWSSVFELYLSVRWWDLPVHFVLNGLSAVIGVALLQRFGALPELPRTALAVLTATLGVTIGVIWEWGEWAGHTFLDPTIFVGYRDTLGDLAVGGAGSLLAGLAARWLLADRR